MSTYFRLLGAVRRAPELMFAESGVSMLDLVLSAQASPPTPPWSVALRLFGEQAELYSTLLMPGDVVLCECSLMTSAPRVQGGKRAVALKVLRFFPLETDSQGISGQSAGRGAQCVPHPEGGLTLQGGCNEVRLVGRLGAPFVSRGEGERRVALASLALLGGAGDFLKRPRAQAIHSDEGGSMDSSNSSSSEALWIDLLAAGALAAEVVDLPKGVLVEVSGSLRLRYREDAVENPFQMQVSISQVLRLQRLPRKPALHSGDAGRRTDA